MHHSSFLWCHIFFYLEFLFLIQQSCRIPRCHSITRISFSLDFVKKMTFHLPGEACNWLLDFYHFGGKNVLTASTNHMSFPCLGHDLCSFQFIQFISRAQKPANRLDHFQSLWRDFYIYINPTMTATGPSQFIN